MRALILILLMVASRCFGDGQDTWFKEISQRVDPRAVQWAQDRLNKTDFKEILQRSTPSPDDQNNAPNHQLLVMMSFSVPEEVWAALSGPVQALGGVFVLRGIPGQSFSSLTPRLRELETQGVAAPVIIHPQLFSKYAVDRVPTFVVCDGEKWDKVTGNVRLSFALSLMARKGETEAAKRLSEKSSTLS